MRKYYLLFWGLIFWMLSTVLQAQTHVRYLQNQTPTYAEMIQFYEDVSSRYADAKWMKVGLTDSGFPLHILVLDKKQRFDPENHPEQVVLLINNGIHPGEPCGIDASMHWVYETLTNNLLSENLIVVIIPAYNVGGMLQRNRVSRANQNGPEEYGFRGNAQNLDLNRDFIKCDAQNTQAFYEVFRTWKPHVFVDTHTSNGADYQHVFTLLSTQKDKIHPALGDYMRDRLEPYIYQHMQEKGFPVIPYVNSIDQIPDRGIKAYMDYPRYSTGYAALFNTMGFTSEAHMFKSFRERVLATKAFIQILVEYMKTNGSELEDLKKTVNALTADGLTFPIDWKWNDTLTVPVKYMGYEASFSPSRITGHPRVFYDRNKPFTDSIQFYDRYDVIKSAEKPAAYVIPQAWKEVTDRLIWNKIPMKQLAKDSLMYVTKTYIDNLSYAKRPYEGHFPHSKVSVRFASDSMQFYAGDWMIPMGYESDYFVVSVLEAEGADSYFKWNFFDAILQQKEWFSPYVFEQEALEILELNPDIKEQFENKAASDTNFLKSDWGAMNFIYQCSERFEDNYRRLPVYRIE
jgi:hypothetical protein